MFKTCEAYKRSGASRRCVADFVYTNLNEEDKDQGQVGVA